MSSSLGSGGGGNRGKPNGLGGSAHNGGNTGQTGGGAGGWGFGSGGYGADNPGDGGGGGGGGGWFGGGGGGTGCHGTGGGGGSGYTSGDVSGGDVNGGKNSGQGFINLLVPDSRDCVGLWDDCSTGLSKVQTFTIQTTKLGSGADCAHAHGSTRDATCAAGHGVTSDCVDGAVRGCTACAAGTTFKAESDHIGDCEGCDTCVPGSTYITTACTTTADAGCSGCTLSKLGFSIGTECSGYSDTAFTACATAPAVNAHYVAHADPSACAWECDSGFVALWPAAPCRELDLFVLAARARVCILAQF